MASDHPSGPHFVWLWALFLLAGIVSANNKIDDSCKAPKGYTQDGKLVKTYDNMYDKIETSLKDVIQIQEDGLALMKKYEESKGLGWFDNYRTRQTFIQFQGDQWKWDNPDASDEDHPADDEIAKEKNWKNFKNTLEKFQRGLNGQGRPYKIFCGQEHLQKYWIDQDGKRSDKPRERAEGDTNWQYYDTYLRDWWKEGEGACSENSKLNGMSPMLKYVVICPELPAKNMMWEIGDTQRTVDWAGKQPDGQLTEDDVKLAQSLDYWGLYMSYTLIHELSHNILTFVDHKLCNGEKAYGYDKASDLVEQDFEKASTNVDNFGYTLLAWYMKTCVWDSGHAKNEAQVQDKKN